MKRLNKWCRLYLLMLSCIILCFMAAPKVSAASSKIHKSGNYEYTVKDGCAEIVRYMGKEATVNIPKKIAGYKVTSIGYEAFVGRKTLRAVIIPDSVTSIATSAFDSCSKLKKAVLPKNLKEIPMRMFNECTSLKTVTIPEKVTKINFAAFRGCSSLENITIPESVVEIESNHGQTFTGCTALKNVTTSAS